MKIKAKEVKAGSTIKDRGEVYDVLRVRQLFTQRGSRKIELVLMPRYSAGPPKKRTASKRPETAIELIYLEKQNYC